MKPSQGANVAAASPVPGADVAVVSPGPAQLWKPSRGADMVLASLVKQK